ncbi:zinc finger protein 438 [Rhynchocyon petersi]
MRNSLSVSPKDQGESTSPSGTIQSRKGVQSRSQFRTIAPKIMPKVLAPSVLPCHSPAFSGQLSPGPSINSKPLVMPSQNYALMQVAGQEGTFSLVTFPHVASVQPIQKPREPLPENIKLPIPRYQPPKNSKASRKKPSLCLSEISCSQPPVQAHMCPQVSPPPANQPELTKETTLSKQTPSPGEALVTVSTDGGGLRDLQPPLMPSCGDVDTPAAPRPTAPQRLSQQQAHTRISGTTASASKKNCNKLSTVHLAKATISLSPPVLGNAVQLTSSTPEHKLPIVPSRAKTAECCKTEPDACMVELSSLEPGADCEKILSIAEGSKAATKVTKLPALKGTKSCPSEGAFSPVPRLELNHKPKRNSSGAARRKTRKQKLPEDTLPFQGKRRKSIINSKRRGENDPQESRNQNLLKKYRNIMPKPVFLGPAWPSLTSPTAVLPFQTTGRLEQDTLAQNSLPSEGLGCKQNDSPSALPSFAFKQGCPSSKRPWHRCLVCNHHFQFKQHLRDHMNTHTNRRLYSCRLCRKTYVRSGSLSTHMKLHHADSRPKRLVCCEFCAKAFSHIKVYFGHLKEVHRVVISTEPCPRDTRPETEEPAERESKPCLEEDFFINQVDEVKLQIKCSRCQITTQSFAEIKFHLLYVHGEEIQSQLQQEVLPGSKAREELVKRAAPFWKQQPERRKLVKHGSSEEGLHVFPKLKRQLYLHQQDNIQIPVKNEGPHLGTSEPGEDSQDLKNPTPDTTVFCSRLGFNCFLCAKILGRKEELLLHWKHQHNCEDPSRLWTILNAFCNQGMIELSSEIEK